MTVKSNQQHLSGISASLMTYQASAAQRDARPGRIRRLVLIGALLAAIVPAVQFGEYVARKTAATVALAEKCRGIPQCNPLELRAAPEATK